MCFGCKYISPVKRNAKFNGIKKKVYKLKCA